MRTKNGLMKTTSLFLKNILAFLLVSLLFFSCKKELSQIGLDIVGGNPLNVLFTDTTNVQVYSVLRDSVRTDGLPYHSLGVVVDPVFGTTKSSLYIQYNLSLSTFTFGETPILDSIVLSMAYKNVPVYGDSMVPLSFRVYELSETIDYDTAHYSNQTLAYLPQLLGEATLISRPFDSVLIDTTYVAPHFSLQLSRELGERLMSYEDTIYYNNVDFTDRFKGLYFEPVYTSGIGNITFFNMGDLYSKITLYYQNEVSDSLSYNLYPGAITPSFQNYDHNNYLEADPDFYQQVIQKDTILGEQKFYMQALGGVDSYIRFPSLFKRADYARYAINEAKLIITNLDPDNMIIPPNNMLLFQQKYSTTDSTNNYFYIADTGGGDAYFGGYYNSTLKQYEFRITKYVQDYIKGLYESDYLLMQITGAAYSGSRLVAGGSFSDDNPQARIRLELIYTEIDTESK